MASPLATCLRVLRCSSSDPEPALNIPAMSAPVEGEEHSALTRYISTRDEALLTLREGIPPTWFQLRRLPMAYLTHVIDNVFPRSAQFEHAFRAGCHAVEIPGDPIAVEPAGSPKGLWIAREATSGVQLAPEEWAQEIADRFGGEVVQEMGSVIVGLSRLKRGARGPFGFWAGSVLVR